MSTDATRVANGLPSRTIGRAWTRPDPPSAILAIRLQAFGDITISLPYLRALKERLPETPIDFVTRREDAPLARAVDVFRRVEEVGGGRSERLQLLALPPLLAKLRWRGYPVVVDLQNNRVSGMIRRVLTPDAWAAFDRTSLTHHGERTRQAIEAAGFPLGAVDFALPLRDRSAGFAMLQAAGWTSDRPLVVLSPSGAWPSRNWPIDSYVAFARRWRERHGAQFAVMGLPAISAKAEALAAALGDSLLNLVGRTSIPQALGILSLASVVLTEDCGLMHMAWTSGVPTLALFGSSRAVWSAPLGPHSRCLHSGDLECGACMDVHCRFGDTHCLTRYTAERVVAEAEDLLAQIGRVRGARSRVVNGISIHP